MTAPTARSSFEVSEPYLEVPEPYLALTNRSLLVALVVMAWASSGWAIAVLAARRGHDLRTLGALGIVFGPLMAGLFLANVAPHEEEVEPIELSPPGRLGGHQRAVVAVLGEPAQVADALPFLRALGPSLGEVILARPITFESADDDDWDDAKEGAARALSEAAVFLDDLRPGQVLLPGTFARALSRYVVGRRVDIAIAVGDNAAKAALCRGGALGPSMVVMANPRSPDPLR